MKEVYWFYVLSNIKIVSCILLGIVMVALIVMIIHFIFSLLDDEPISQKFKKILNVYILPLLIVSLLGVLFIPSKTDMLAIFGIGTTIDYVQSNEEVKEIPDAAVKAMNIWLESITNKSQE